MIPPRRTAPLPSLALLLLSFMSTEPAAAGVVESGPVAPGLDYARYEEEGLIAHVLKIDLKEKSLRLRSVKAKGKETVNELVQRMDDGETMVVGGINGDFFRQDSEAGIPYGVQVSDGRLIFAPMKRSMIGFGPENEPYIGIVSLRAKLTFSSKATRGSPKWIPIDDVNVSEKERSRESGIFLYTPAFLELTMTKPMGLIAVVEAIQPALQVGDICEGKVARVEVFGNPVEVPEAGCLLYFLGDAARALAATVKRGQPVALKVELPPIAGGVTQALGGGPRLIRDGRTAVEFNRETFAAVHVMEISKRHPRSAIGHDRNKRYLYLVMVEGRHDGSRGMTFNELANFLQRLGCYQAMAFDGGGSAGMYVGGRGIVSKSMGDFNVPEARAVANGLLITAPRKALSSEAQAKNAGKSREGEGEAGSDEDPSAQPGTAKKRTEKGSKEKKGKTGDPSDPEDDPWEP